MCGRIVLRAGFKVCRWVTKATTIGWYDKGMRTFGVSRGRCVCVCGSCAGALCVYVFAANTSGTGLCSLIPGLINMWLKIQFADN